MCGVTRSRDFGKWVDERLAEWPSEQILDFERWLREQELVEFLPAVREAAGRRSVEEIEEYAADLERLDQQLAEIVGQSAA